MYKSGSIIRQLVLSFIMINLILISIICVGLYQLYQVTNDLNMQVFDTNVKLQLTSDMHEALHVRRNSLYRIVETEDVFARVDEWTIFNEAASTYLAARQQLSELLVSDTEKELMAELNQLTLEAQPVQLAVIELVYDDNLDEASELLFAEAKPLQKIVIEKLTELMRLEEQAGLDISSDAKIAYKNAFYSMLTLGFLAIIISILIAVVITRSVGDQILQTQTQQRKYRALFESSLDAIILWREWKLTQCNDSARRLFLIDHNIESSLTLLDLLPSRQSNGDEPAKVIANLMRKTTEFELYHCQMQRTDGEVFYADIRISSIWVDDAEMIQMLIRDITNRDNIDISEELNKII